jgi:hypothetical protein
LQKLPPEKYIKYIKGSLRAVKNSAQPQEFCPGSRKKTNPKVQAG